MHHKSINTGFTCSKKPVRICGVVYFGFFESKLLADPAFDVRSYVIVVTIHMQCLSPWFLLHAALLSMGLALHWRL